MRETLRHRSFFRMPLRLYLLVCSMLMSVHAVASGATDPAGLLTEMTENVLREIRSNPDMLADEVRVRALAERLILPNIDFRVASQWVLGKHWRTASTAQRDAFVLEFRELLLNTYMRSLEKYRDNTIRILAARPGQPDGRAVVDAEVVQANGPLVKVLFRLHRKGTDWLVYDIAIEGISLIATHRSGFAKEIRSKGLDSLIAHLVLLNASEATAAGQPSQGAR